MKAHALILAALTPMLSLGQARLDQKFVNDAINESNYIIFNSDSTFKYRFSYHLLHDISCGQYSVIKDTIFLSFKSDLRDSICNSEIDALHFDTRVLVFRPDKLFYRDNKLYKIEDGKVVYRTEKFQPGWEIPKTSRKYYRRKYVLFGPLVSKTNSTYYMVATSQAKWAKKKHDRPSQ